MWKLKGEDRKISLGSQRTRNEQNPNPAWVEPLKSFLIAFRSYEYNRIDRLTVNYLVKSPIIAV